MTETGIALKPHRVPSAESRLRNTRYHTASDFHVNHEVKQEQRGRVLQFILENHPQTPVRFFGLPGLHWEFEKLFQQTIGPREDCKFRGVEHSWSVLERSVAHMPGHRPEFFSESTLIGAPQGFRTDKAKVYFGSASALLAFCRGEFAGKGKWTNWRRRFRHSCIWLDFTSQFCAETRRAIEAVSNIAFTHHHPVPLSITLLYGRDDIQGGLAAREKELMRLIDNERHYFKPRSNWYYQSATGARMATFCGLIFRRHIGKRK